MSTSKLERFNEVQDKLEQLKEEKDTLVERIREVRSEYRELRRYAILEKGLLSGEWKAKPPRNDKYELILVAHWDDEHLEEAVEILGPSYHSTCRLSDSVTLNFDDGEVRLELFGYDGGYKQFVKDHDITIDTSHLESRTEKYEKLATHYKELIEMFGEEEND